MASRNYIRKIETARRRLAGVARQTPIDEAPLLSQRIGNRVLLKREDLQPIFSFKLRGAYNKIAALSEAKRTAGVVAASAGNHAQGVALSAQTLGVRAFIVMPRTTPSIKVEAVRTRGARVILHGDTYDEADSYAKQAARERGWTLISPYDDADVIAGQGTIAAEIHEQQSAPLHAVFVPVGGGGLLAGMAAFLRPVRPRLKIYGVEPADAACLAAALKADRRVKLPEVGLFADGAAVAQVGREPFRVLKEVGINGVICVSNDEICAAIKDIFEDTRSIAEPAGALALAGLKKYAKMHRPKGRTLLAVHSGANINFDRLRHISERTEIGEHREAVFSVTIPEQKGSFWEFCRRIGRRNITEFNYRYADSSEARVFVGVQIAPGGNDRNAICKSLREGGYRVVDMTDDEMAKLHIRHMVGGCAPASLQDEVIYRVRFPERPGALLSFLGRLGRRWNISLFHYRNHGTDYGRILVGIQAAKKDLPEVRRRLSELGFPWHEETDNPAYRDFLRRE